MPFCSIICILHQIFIHVIHIYSHRENIIGAPKCEIELLNFSLLLLVKLSLLIFFAFLVYCICSFPSFLFLQVSLFLTLSGYNNKSYFSLTRALRAIKSVSTIAIAIFGRAITIQRALKKRSHVRAITKWGAKEKISQY